MLWKIYYSDKTFSNEDGSPEDAPPTGVICIKQVNKIHGWVVTAFKDFYLWHDDEWWGADNVGFWQYMFESGSKVVKFGLSIPSEQFNEIMNKAIADEGFGEKSAISPLELKGQKGWSAEK